jgi:hypothetical protein
VGANVGTCSPGQVDPTGEWKRCKQSLTRDGNCSVNLASQGHCTGVFIGTRVSDVPRQGRLCPRVPGLSLEYSHKGGLQTVITEKLLRMRPCNLPVHAGLIAVGRIPRGPPGEMRGAGPADFIGVWPSSCNGGDEGQLCRSSRLR